METKKIGIILIGIVLSSVSHLYAQSYAESALLFSRTTSVGSARVQGIGGSQIAIGGDFSSATSNPAGLGMYNRSEFTFTPALNFYNTRADYKGTRRSASTSRLTVPGLSLVYNMPNERESDWVGGSLAITLSRTNDFNRSINYRGRNNQSSIIDSFIDQANGDTDQQFDTYNYNTPTGLAYYNFLIGPKSTFDENEPDDEYFTDAPLGSEQREEIETRGSTTQINLAYGANFKDILFLGAGFGVSNLKFKSQKFYSEAYDDPQSPVENMALSETLTLQGTGINASVGAIVRPVNFFQVGISYTTPTYTSISESYSASMSSRWDNFDYYGDGSEILGDNSGNPVLTDEVVSDYALTAPSKVSTGIAFLSKYGFITADLDMTNPGNAKYSSRTGDISFGSDNDDIKYWYRRAISYRLGIEGRVKAFRIRAGYGLQGNTMRSDAGFSNEIQTISGGVGYRASRFFMDFALSHSSFDSFYNPYYSSIETPTVDLKNKMTTGVLTFGFTF